MKIILVIVILLMIFIIPLSQSQYNSVTFIMEFSGDYISSKSDNYVCLYEQTAKKPVTGILSKGMTNSVFLENETNVIMKVSQDFGHNSFIIPVTQDGCEKIRKRANSINDNILSAFIPLDEQKVFIKLLPNIDLFGNFVKNVPLNLILEKNKFSQIEIRVK